jgi:hypothetical protein
MGVKEAKGGGGKVKHGNLAALFTLCSQYLPSALSLSLFATA